jgi:hypothetical protein
VFFNWAPRHEGVLGELKYSSTHSLTSALEVSGQLYAPAALSPGKRSPGIRWIGGWVGPRAVLDAVVKKEILSPRRESNPRTSIVQPVAQRYTDWAVTALVIFMVKVKLSLCFNWVPRHEGVWGEWRYSSTHTLTSVVDEGEWSASRPGRSIPRERAPGTHWIGGWVGPESHSSSVV